MNKSQYNVRKTTETIMNRPGINECIPRLKKNRRLELRWGQQYYTALKDAVFSVRNSCHMSAEMPASLKENNQIIQKNFICKSCGDSFHFQSSFEDHNSRYSWILGYWCSCCFQIQCGHTIDESLLCLTCHNMNKSKRAYLKTKGLRKGQKVGAILLFYNQCQFFEHLKKHNVTVVDMGDIMLMPLPHNIQHDEYSQIDHVCKALMEYMFIKRIHIVDWLRINNIGGKWWKTENAEDNAIGELLKNYYTDCTNTTMTTPKEQFSNGDCTIMNDDEHASESSEDDDNPCGTDISFVDCDSTNNNFIDAKQTVAEESISLPPTSNKPSAMLASVSEMNDLTKEQSIKISTSTSLHPLNSIYNKKIIIISQASEVHGEGDAADNNKVEIAGKEKNTRTTTVITSPLLSVNSNVVDAKTIPIAMNKNLSYMRTSDRRVVLPPGAKIVFRQLQKPATSILKVDLDKNSGPLATPKFNIVKNKLKIFPAKIVTPHVDQTNDVVMGRPESEKSTDPSGTPIESSKVLPSENKELIAVPTTEVVEEPSVNLNKKIAGLQKTLRQKKTAPKEVKIDINESEFMILKYRESMERNLQQCGKQMIQAIIDSIKDVNRKYQITKKCVDVKNITVRNMAAIKKFEKYMNNACDGNVKVNIDDRINDEFDSESRDWESQYYRAMIKPECNKCHRKLKPMNYVIGISKPATNELKFCQCYNCICHLCDSKLGNQKRYQAHIRFHKKESPYVCPECDDTFNSMFHLETHIWTKCFHIMTQQFFSCQICEIDGFITMEDVTRHYAHVHARSAVFCNECQRLFNSYSDYQAHYLEEHTAVDSSIADPARFLICEFGRCLVRPENFHAHIQTHIEIATVTYYTCPFCIFFIKDIAKNRQIIQDHVLGKHAPRLREVITLQTARFLTGGCKFTAFNPQRYVPIAPATNVVPRIVSTCSIPSETFGLASCSGKEPLPQDTGNISRIDVQSDEVDENSQIQCIKNRMIIPQIVNVTSINTTVNQLENAETSNRILMFAPGKIQNGNMKLHGENGGIISLSKPCVMVQLNPTVEEHCDSAKESNMEADDVDTVNMKGIKESSIEQMKVQHEAPTVPSVKEEKVDAVDPPPLPPQQQQHSLITQKNNISSADVTSTIPIVETRIEQKEISESSCDDVAEMRKPSLSLRKHPVSAQEKEKVTKKIMSNIQLSIKRKRRRRRPWRIALNGPNNSDIPPLNYKCHLCSEMISTSWSIVNSHFNTKHSRDYKVAVIAPMLTRLSTTFMKTESKDDGRKRKLDSCITTVKKRRRWAHKKFPDRSTSPSLGICIRQESLQDTEGNFKCKKCECLFTDVNTLRDHVASNHRIRGHFLICLECGENFVVAPSLQMHLKAFHGITDPITYMAQNTAYAPDMTDELEAQERIIESNQCYVCRAVFEDKAAVDKHMRVHGMAFLNRKRIEARNALKSPEKKGEITNSTTNKNKVGQEIKEKNSNANINNQDVLPESDSANDMKFHIVDK